MLKSEFIEMGGKPEDYELANNVYSTFNFWLDRHEFLPFWQAFGNDAEAYMELENLKKFAWDAYICTEKLLPLHEFVARRAQQLKEINEELIRVTAARVARLERILATMESNPALYKR